MRYDSRGLDLTPPFLEQKQRDMRDETPVIVVSHGLTGGELPVYQPSTTLTFTIGE